MCGKIIICKKLYVLGLGAFRSIGMKFEHWYMSQILTSHPRLKNKFFIPPYCDVLN